MPALQNGALALLDGKWNNRLELHCWLGRRWQALPLAQSGDGWTAGEGPVRVTLKLRGDEGDFEYTLGVNSETPTRICLRLSVGEASRPFHIIPANIFGDNNLGKSEPGHFPNLTREHPHSVSCATTWELRADRASHPVSILCFDGGLAAVSVEPYTNCWISDSTSREGFVRNGLFAQLADDDQTDACGVTLGYRNTPVSFVNKDQWGVPTEHLLTEGRISGRIMLREAGSRLDVHDVIRRVYADHASTPVMPLAPGEAAEALTTAFLTINWQPDKENFTNMHCTDPEKRMLKPWRTLAEVGWTGGGVIGYPLLLAGEALNIPAATRRGLYMLDWVGEAYNPASGLLWDICGKQEGKRVNGWWSGYIVKDCHCAYTNGSGLYYLLKSLDFRRQRGHEHPRWLETARKALDTIIRLQRDDGNFGYTYCTERPEVLDWDGFAGVWFVPALVYAWQFTRMPEYIEAARRGIAFYHALVRELNCYGTPMDTWKSVDQEGNLGFIRGARMLHAATNEDRFLEMLVDGAHYEYLWRYGFRARPEYAPLKHSHWHSCGGSVTSVSNPHIHPMGIFISSELRYLADQLGDNYHHARFEDGVNWGINAVSLYPEASGYGQPGVLTERFCPSDGLTIETFPDGTPSSLWFSYNGWAAAAVLEGIAEQIVGD